MSQVPLSSEERFSGPFKPGMCDEPMQNPLPKYDGDPWEVLYKHLSEPDLARCKAWREEVENLLIFAGLFSAVVTAFIIESYKSLREDYGDTSTALLRRIALHLEGNGTVIVQPFATAFSPSSSSVRVNILWFMSLILSLSSVLIGTLCLQWLREHLNLPTRPRDAVALHHMQKESLDRWRVPEIFTALPLLLQSGLILFFIGIVDFLWQLHHTVAGVLLAVIALALIFYVVTTVAPAIQDLFLRFPHTSRLPRSPCPYRSPQSLVFLRMARPAITFLQPRLLKAWLWVRYWGKYDNSIINGFTSQAHEHITSWTRHHRKWLIQRDYDVFLFHQLPQAQLWAWKTRYLLSDSIDSPTSFYDHILPISMSLYSPNKSLSGSLALRHCLEGFIEDVQNVTKIHVVPPNSAMPALLAFTLRNYAPKAEWSKIPSPILRDFIVVDVIGIWPGLQNPLEPYVVEKGLRVIYSILRQHSTASRGNNAPVSATRYLLKASMRLLEHERYFSSLQDLLNTFLEDISPLPKLPDTVKLTVLFMAWCGHMVYRHLNNVHVHQRHILTLQTLTKLFKSSSQSRAFITVVASHYLFTIFISGSSRLALTLEESHELLLLLQSYRKQCLYGTVESDIGRSRLLALQKIVVADRQYYHWALAVQPRPLHSDLWKNYLIGMFDISEATVDDNDEVKDFYKSGAYEMLLFFRKIVGTYVHTADLDSRQLEQIANASERDKDLIVSEAVVPIDAAYSFPERDGLYPAGMNHAKLADVTSTNPEEADPDPGAERSTALLESVELGVIRDGPSAALVDSPNTTAGPSQMQFGPVNLASSIPEYQADDPDLPQVHAKEIKTRTTDHEADRDAS